MIKKNSKFGEYSILNRQEVLPWFLEKRRENQIACNFCQKAGCYVCNQFIYIREQLEKSTYFEAQDWPRQPILWQVFDKFDKPPNCQKNIYRLRIYIERTVKSNSFVKKNDFENDKIIEIL